MLKSVWFLVFRTTFWQFFSLLWEIFLNIFRTKGFSTVSLGCLYCENNSFRLEKRMENTVKKILCQHRWMSLGVGDRGEPFIQIDGEGVSIVPITENNEVLMIVEPSVTEK